MTAPLILTLGLHADDQARFEALRQSHFPAAHNQIPAHLTLFHHLPGEEFGAVADSVRASAAAHAAFAVPVVGLRSLGRGVAYTLASPALLQLRAGLARHWHERLTAQDRQGWRPHVTIQNKATPHEAASLLTAMQAGFAPFTVRAESLLLWRYLGGPWQLAERFAFGRADAFPAKRPAGPDEPV
jgi:2'-5' RNA ligase